MGRFLQTDPIGYADQINLYAYVGGDPLNATDPSGMTQCAGPRPDHGCTPGKWGTVERKSDRDPTAETLSRGAAAVGAMATLLDTQVKAGAISGSGPTLEDLSSPGRAVVRATGATGVAAMAIGAIADVNADIAAGVPVDSAIVEETAETAATLSAGVGAAWTAARNIPYGPQAKAVGATIAGGSAVMSAEFSGASGMAGRVARETYETILARETQMPEQEQIFIPNMPGP